MGKKTLKENNMNILLAVCGAACILAVLFLMLEFTKPGAQEGEDT